MMIIQDDAMIYKYTFLFKKNAQDIVICSAKVVCRVSNVPFQKPSFELSAYDIICPEKFPGWKEL